MSALLTVDPALLSGADLLGRVHMNAPNPVQPGSSVSLWDPLTAPNQLMEPAINFDLTHSLVPPQDLTVSLLRDIGWYPDSGLDGFPDADDECDASDLRLTLFVGGTDTGVPNLMFTNGCTMGDYVIAAAASAGNHGGFVSAVAHLGNAWLDAGLITDEQLGHSDARGAVGCRKKEVALVTLAGRAPKRARAVSASGPEPPRPAQPRLPCHPC